MQFNKPKSSKAFFNAFEDANVFDSGDFNLLKVAQDAVVRSLGKNNHRTYFDKPKVWLNLWLAVKRMGPHYGMSQLPTIGDPKILVMLPPRVVKLPDNNSELQFLGNILDLISREKMHLLFTYDIPPYPVDPDWFVPKIIAAYEHIPVEPWENIFLKELNQCFKRISTEAQFSAAQLDDIRVGFDEFWRKFRAFRKYLSMLSLTKAVLIPGYQTEHIIAALRSLKVEVIEIQHGVITTSSPFYCYPEKVKPVVKKALFADRIWMMGKFWKKELLKGAEYDESQVDILGDYFVRSMLPPENFLVLNQFEEKFETRILIGTQTNRHEAFNLIVTNLSAKYAQQKTHVGILVKKHPAEKQELYANLEKLPNVLLVDASLDFLYPRCTVYVSMYSNTLFEAVRYPQLKLFVLESQETIDLVEGIVATGVAVRIKLDEDPLELAPSNRNLNPDDFFDSSLNTGLLKSLGGIYNTESAN